MKKFFIFILLLFLVVGTIFAYDYPYTLAGLLQQYYERTTELIVTIVSSPKGNNKLEGYIVLVQKDYIVFKDAEEGVMVVSIFNIGAVQAK